MELLRLSLVEGVEGVEVVEGRSLAALIMTYL
jgi:hypothetical protein